MATRPKGYGLTAELSRKTAAKYSVEQDRAVRQWMSKVTGGNVPLDAVDMKKFSEDFKDGVALCNLINVIRPGSVKKINSSKMAFKMMENIGNYLSSAEAYGVSKVDSFQTVDLYEAQNIPQVIAGLLALERRARKAGFNGPLIEVA